MLDHDDARPTFQIVVPSPYGFEETLTRLREGIKGEGFLLLQEIDTQGILRANGIAIAPLRQLLFFHPRYLKAILDAHPAGVIEAPLKLVVIADDTGAVIVRAMQPLALFERYAGLETIGRELDGVVRRVLAALADTA